MIALKGRATGKGVTQANRALVCTVAEDRTNESPQSAFQWRQTTTSGNPLGRAFRAGRSITVPRAKALGCSLKPLHGQKTESATLCPEPFSGSIRRRLSFPIATSITSGAEPNDGPIPSAKVG
jgi:hypothetical protein